MLAIVFVAIPALVLAATFTVSGTATGTADTAAPAAGAMCNPPAAVNPEDYICDSTIAGTFTLSELGTGTYTGNVRLDWSAYTTAEPCAQASGTVAFTNGADSITTTLDNTSVVCESKPASDTYTMTMQSTVTGGTGQFASPTGGSFATTGTLVKVAGSPGDYTSTQSIVGSVSVADPVPTATPAATPTATAAPTATVAPAIVPDTSTGGPDAGLLVVLGLGAVILASASYRAMRGSATS
jgi:hypothetical protein